MADVTDRAFRRMIVKYGKYTRPHSKIVGGPDVMWTEFVSADGLFLGGYDALINDLSFTKKERPIVAQFFTSKPEMIEKAARLAVELGFDGIDINMGCPDRSIEKQNAGAKLITNPKLAQEIIYSAKRGAGKSPRQPLGEIPVSVKTRVGWSKNELETWLPVLLETNPAVITIHARTRKELSLVPARWEHIKRAVEIRDGFIDSKGNKSKTLIIGNGDVRDLDDAKAKAKETGCDGVMIGRAFFGTPWLLNPRASLGQKEQYISTQKRLKILLEHAKLFEKLCHSKPPTGQGKNFAIMKKHYKAYVTGWDGAKELRRRLMETKNAKEVEKIINNYLIHVKSL